MKKAFFAFMGFVFFLTLGGIIDGILNPNYKIHMNPFEWPLIISSGVVGAFIGWRAALKIELTEKKTGTKIMGLNVWMYGLLGFIILGIVEYIFGFMPATIVFLSLVYYWSREKKQDSRFKELE